MREGKFGDQVKFGFVWGSFSKSFVFLCSHENKQINYVDLSGIPSGNYAEVIHLLGMLSLIPVDQAYRKLYKQN